MATASSNDGGGVRVTNREIYDLALETRDRTLDIQRDVGDLKTKATSVASRADNHEIRLSRVEEIQARSKSVRAFAAWLVSPAVILGAAFIGSRLH